MIYRLATKNDIEALANLRWEFKIDESYEIDVDVKDIFIKECSEFLLDGIENNTWVYWVAEDDEEIISNIYVNIIKKVPKPHKLDGKIGYMTNVYTVPSYRNKGIGRELLKKVKEWSENSDIELLIVWPSERAINFYESEGFASNNDILELLLQEE